MATKKPRLSITFDPDLYEVIKRLSEYQDMPMSKIVHSYLSHLQPHLEEILLALEMLEQKKDPAPILNKMLVDSQQSVFELLKDLQND